MTTAQTTQPLGYFGDYLTKLAENPPATSDEHKTAAATLLRHAAAEARNLPGHGQQTEARVSTLTRLATTHILLADILAANLVLAANL